MIKLTYEGVTYDLPNTPQELTIKQFEYISSLLNNEKDTLVDRWTNVLLYLKVPVEVIAEIEPSAFFEIIKNYNSLSNTEYIVSEELIIKNVSYKLTLDDNGKPKFKVKDISIIEKAIKDNDEEYLSTIMAVAYKRDDIDNTIQYDKAHINYKKELFEQESADKVIPILVSLGGIFIKDYELIKKNAEG